MMPYSLGQGHTDTMMPYSLGQGHTDTMMPYSLGQGHTDTMMSYSLGQGHICRSFASLLTFCYSDNASEGNTIVKLNNHRVLYKILVNICVLVF